MHIVYIQPESMNVNKSVIILSSVRVTVDGVLDWILDLLTTCRSQLQITDSFTELHTPNITVKYGT
jgi:hypothetical protein